MFEPTRHETDFKLTKAQETSLPESEILIYKDKAGDIFYDAPQADGETVNVFMWDKDSKDWVQIATVAKPDENEVVEEVPEPEPAPEPEKPSRAQKQASQAAFYETLKDIGIPAPPGGKLKDIFATQAAADILEAEVDGVLYVLNLDTNDFEWVEKAQYEEENEPPASVRIRRIRASQRK